MLRLHLLQQYCNTATDNNINNNSHNNNNHDDDDDDDNENINNNNITISFTDLHIYSLIDVKYDNIMIMIILIINH